MIASATFDRLAIRLGSRLVAIGSWLVTGQYWPIIDRVTGRTWPDDAPYVCPGCHAVAEPCAPGCIDAEIEAEREERARLDDDEDDPWEDQ